MKEFDPPLDPGITGPYWELVFRLLLLLLLALPAYATGTLVQQPHGEHTGTDAQRDETAPWVRMAINAETPVQQKTEKVWAGLTAGSHAYYFEYLPGLTEFDAGTCEVAEASDCDVTTYSLTPTLAKTGCPTGFLLGWCWTGTVNVTDGNEIKVAGRYTQTYPGYGATDGGKSATIIHVTNANASGAGSLQAAILDGCQNNAGRYIVFDVAPTINLPNSGLRICGKETTIDGWTAPGLVSVTTASVHFNCLDPDNSTPRGLNNIILRNVVVDPLGVTGVDPLDGLITQRGTSTTSCDTVLGSAGSRSAKIVLANIEVTNSRDDTLTIGARNLQDGTVFQSHMYCPGCDGGFILGDILIDGYRWTLFRQVYTQIADRTPFVTYHAESSPNGGNAPDLSIEIVNSVIAMGEQGGTVHGVGIARGASANIEDNVFYGGSVMGNATPGIDNTLVVCKDLVSSSSEDGNTGKWINPNTGNVCEESPVNCGDNCESSDGAYVNNNVMLSTYARAPRVRPSDWKTRSTAFSTPHTLPRWDFAVDGDHQDMAHDVANHSGAFPRQSTPSTNIAAALTEIDAATLALRGEADEDTSELDTAGHLTEVGTPVYSGDVAFASGAGTDAILYDGADDIEQYLEFRFRKTANPAGTITLVDMQSGAAASLCKLELLTGGTLRVNDGTNTAQVAPTQIGALANATWYKILMHYQKASAGSCSPGTGLDGTCGYCEAAISEFWGYPLTGTTGLLTDASQTGTRPTAQTNVAAVILPDESDAATFYFDEIHSCPSFWCLEGGAGMNESTPPPVGGSQGPLQIHGNAVISGNVTITQ